MKKNLLIITIGLVMLLLCSCSGNDTPDSTTTETPSTKAQNDITANAEIPETQNSQETTESEITIALPVGGDDEFTLDDMSMRYMYYSLTYPHAQLVEDKEAFDKWYEEIVVTDDMDEMLLVTFVKHFNIPKEDFEKANEEWIRIITEDGDTPVMPPFDTAHEAELDEVPNADVIYTFDNEFIKEYYKRENANVTLEILTTAGDGFLDVPNEETTAN